MDEPGKIKRYLYGCLVVLALASALGGIAAHGWNPAWSIVFLLFYSVVLTVAADVFHCRAALLLLIPYVNIAAGGVMFHRLRGGIFNIIHFLLYGAAVLCMWVWPGTVAVSVLLVLLPLSMILVVGRISALPRGGTLFGFSPVGQLMVVLPLAAVFLLAPLWGYRECKIRELGLMLEELETRPLPPQPHAVEWIGSLSLEELVRIEHFGMNRTWSEMDVEPLDNAYQQVWKRLMDPQMVSQPEKWLVCSQGVQRWFDQDFRLFTVYREQLDVLAQGIAGISGEALREYQAWAGFQEKTMPEFNELSARVELAYIISGRMSYQFLLRKMIVNSVIYIPVIGVCVNDLRHAGTEYYRLRPVLEERRQSYARPSAAGVIAEYSLLEKYTHRLADELASLRIGRTVAALELYRRANGGYPQNLTQLTPDFLSAVPLDPYTGEPLKYTEGQCVYSVGRNLQDDGGVGQFETRTMDYDIICRPGRN
jgi:hypothetical protein